MIDKALRYKGITGELVALPFTDKHLITYKESVQRLYSLKVVNGIGNNEFDPRGTATRGQAAAFIVKMLDSMQNKRKLLISESTRTYIKQFIHQILK